MIRVFSKLLLWRHFRLPKAHHFLSIYA